MTKEDTMTKLKIDDIRTDGGTQSRASLNPAVVDDYSSIIRDGGDFPPVVVFHDGKAYWLADGFHRVEAYRSAGAVEIDADVRQGDKREAILFSVGANASHGLRRTNDDKRRAVMTLLNDAEWSKWSDRQIAKQCGVSHNFVSSLRPSLSSDDSEARTYTTKHGTTATMDTAKIGKPKPSDGEQAKIDRAREETAAQFSPEVQQHRARTEEYREQAKVKAKPSCDVDALRAEIEEKDEYIASLEAEVADLKKQIAKFDDMVVQYEKGGFEAVLAAKDEEIRVLESRLYAESADKASWIKLAKAKDKSIALYKAEAEKRGYTDPKINKANAKAEEDGDEYVFF